MMKGNFKYENKTFRWKFKVRYYEDCGHFNADSIIFYKNNYLQVIPECIIYDKGNYRNLIEFYNNKSDEEIDKIIKDKIIQNYKFLIMESKFT